MQMSTALTRAYDHGKIAYGIVMPKKASIKNQVPSEEEQSGEESA